MKISPYIDLNRIEFVVTYRCTGSCAHCSLGDKLNRPGDRSHVRPEAAADMIERLSRLFPIASVMTFGGEPLLCPEVTAAIHRAAAHCGVGARQLITNGYFTKDENRIREVAGLLKASGVNDLLISVDAFHQRTIPLDAVRRFAESAKQAGIPDIRLSPAWVVNSGHENPYNSETKELLAKLSGFPVSEGNDIILEGNAAETLAEYYPPGVRPTSPYYEPPTAVKTLSVEPGGDVTASSFVIGNIYDEDIEDIIARYDPSTYI